MLTPQELQEKKFAKAVFGGYDMGEVDEFLDEVVADYEKLFKETAILKSKLKTLAEKVEEYRSVDEEMRRTLAAAKRSSEEQVAEAQRLAASTRAEADKYAAETRADADSYSERLLAEARAGAQELAERSKKASENMLETTRNEMLDKLASLRAEVDAEQKRLDEARAEIRRYAAETAELCRKQLETLREVVAQSSTSGKTDAPAKAAPSAPAAPSATAPVDEIAESFDASDEANAEFAAAFKPMDASSVNIFTEGVAPAPQDDEFATKRVPVEEIRITERHAAGSSASAAHAAEENAVTDEPTIRFEAIRRVDVGGETVELDDEQSDDDVFRDYFGGGENHGE